MNLETRQAYSEVNRFLELIGEEMSNKIPLKLRNFFEREMDKNYNPIIDIKIPIKEQKLKRKTIVILASLNLQYWCKDEKEKERLQKIYSKNEKIYRENMRTLYSSSNMFKKEVITDESKEENISQQIVEYKESFLKKLINKVLNIFRLK